MAKNSAEREQPVSEAAPARLPAWFKQKVPRAGEMAGVERSLRELGLHTVCEGAHCPNRGFCFAHGTASFLIMGESCTRHCTFCTVRQGKPAPLEAQEPARLTEAVRRLGLSYVVVTSVTRDDLPDGGAGHFARTVAALHQGLPGIKVEALVPDFQGVPASVATVVQARPEVFAHNLETVPRLYGAVRPQAQYARSLAVLRQAREAGAVTKSALMLGLGETKDEVRAVLEDLRGAGCDLLTLGQYLAGRGRHPVARYLAPAEFAEYEELSLAMGFAGVAAGPLVRSSFQAAELFHQAEAGRPAQT